MAAGAMLTRRESMQRVGVTIFAGYPRPARLLRRSMLVEPRVSHPKDAMADWAHCQACIRVLPLSGRLDFRGRQLPQRPRETGCSETSLTRCELAIKSFREQGRMKVRPGLRGSPLCNDKQLRRIDSVTLRLPKADNPAMRTAFCQANQQHGP